MARIFQATAANLDAKVDEVLASRLNVRTYAYAYYYYVYGRGEGGIQNS